MRCSPASAPTFALVAAVAWSTRIQIPRGLDRALFLKLAACDWIAERCNLLVTGASGLGKSWLACALGHKACRKNMSVLYTRMPRLFADLAIAHGDARYACARMSHFAHSAVSACDIAAHRH